MIQIQIQILKSPPSSNHSKEIIVYKFNWDLNPVEPLHLQYVIVHVLLFRFEDVQGLWELSCPLSLWIFHGIE